MESEVGPSAGELAVLDDITEDENTKPDEKAPETPKEEETSEEEILDGDEEESEEDKETSEDEDTDEEEVKEEETEEKEDEPDEEDPKFSAQDDRPSYKDIKTKYPTFFKDFPGARTALFREREFAAIFPTVESAKDAEDKVGFYIDLDREITSGNAEILLKGIADNDKNESVRSFSENFLPALEKLDSDIYVETIKPVIIKVLQHTLHEAASSKNKNLQLAVAHISNSLFGKPTLPTVEKKAEDPEIVRERAELKRQRDELSSSQFKQNHASVQSRVIFKSHEFIDGLIKDLKVTNYTRDKLKGDIFNETDALMGKDAAFRTKIQHLWAQASQANYDPKAVASIRQAYLERFKSIAPAIKRKLVARALGNRKQGKVVSKTETSNKRVAFTQRREESKNTAPKNSGGMDEQMKILG